MNFFRITLPLLSILLPLCTQGQSLSKAEIRDLTQLLSPLVDEQTPGLAVAVIRNGEEVYSFTGGLANMEFGIPVSTSTRFNIASNAKQFTALFALELVAQGMLNPEDDIRKFIPDLYPDIQDAITISHLLRHRSGIRDFYDLLGIQGITWWAEEGFSNEDAIDVLRNQHELNFRPGSDYLYSNSNYVLLAEIISRVTEEDYEVWSQTLFEKMGMSQTSFAGDYMAVMPERSRPYAYWGVWKEYPAIFNVMGDGNLYTSLSDQITWEKMVQTGQVKGISKQSLIRSQARIDPQEVYGYGVEHQPFRGTSMIAHDGNTGAFNASFVRFPEQKLSVIVMSNHGALYPHGLARECAQIILKLEETLPETPQAPEQLTASPPLSDLTGQYQHQDGSLVGFILEDGALAWKQGQNRPFEMEQVEGNLFQMVENRNLRVSFHEEADSAWMVVYFPGSEPRIHQKALPIQHAEEWWNAANGIFRNEELGLDFSISYQGEQTYEARTREWSGNMTMLFPDALRMDDGYRISFVRQENGQVHEVLLSSDRAVNIRFRRTD